MQKQLTARVFLPQTAYKLISEEMSYIRRLDLRLDTAMCESVWIELPHASSVKSSRNIVIGIVLVPIVVLFPVLSISLEALLNTLVDEKRTVFLMDDVNIDIGDLDSVSCEEYVNCFLAYGLTSLVKLPTELL